MPPLRAAARLPALLALVLLASRAAADFGAPSLVAPDKGQYLGHVADGQSVFVLGRESVGRRYVARYDRPDASVWRVQLDSEAGGAGGNVAGGDFIALDQGSVFVYTRSYEDSSVGMLELDPETGKARGARSVVPGFTKGASGNGPGEARLMTRVNGQTVAYQTYQSGTQQGRLLPSQLVIPDINLNGPDLAHIGDGRLIIAKYGDDGVPYTLRLYDAIKGVQEEATYPLYGLPQGFPHGFVNIHVSSAAGFVYVMYHFGENGFAGGRERVILTKLRSDNLQQVWTRDFPTSFPAGFTARNRWGTATAGDGLVALTFPLTFPQTSDTYKFDGFDLTPPAASSEPLFDFNHFNTDIIVAMISEDDGSTLAVTSTSTAGIPGQQADAGGVSMMDADTVALAGYLAVTNVGPTGGWSWSGQVTGSPVGFLPFNDGREQC